MNSIEIEVAELVAFKQLLLQFDVSQIVLVLVKLEADLALLIKLRDCILAAITIENVFGQRVNRWTKALVSVCLFDLLEEFPHAEPFWQRCRDGSLGLADSEWTLAL